MKKPAYEFAAFFQNRKDIRRVNKNKTTSNKTRQGDVYPGTQLYGFRALKGMRA